MDEWRAAFSQTSGGNPNTIHPDPNQSHGGSKSEREQSGVPLPKGDPPLGQWSKAKVVEQCSNAAIIRHMYQEGGF
jgi:hypothetical protein